MIKLEPKQQAVVFFLVAVILFGGGYRLAQVQSRSAQENSPSLQQAAGETGAGAAAKEIAVHVSGAVARPGLYRLTQGARVADAVEKAGPLDEADLNAINLAAPLADGQKVPVPLKGEVQAGAPAGAGPVQRNAGVSAAAPRSVGPAGPVNINTAGAAELDTLPGIGPALAQRIIQYRETNGPFKQVEDLKNVSGIGDKKFAELKDRITVW